MEHEISDHLLSVSEAADIALNHQQLSLSDSSIEKVKKCRAFLNTLLNQDDKSHYGINTGFGKLYNVVIPKDKIRILQDNLLISHAVGVGKEVHPAIVKLMLFLKIQSLSLGHSGIKMDTLNRLIDLYNYDCLPIVFEKGSLGASGDLAPLSHLSLPLLGEGEVLLKGEKMSTKTAYQKLDWKPIELGAKEGLALINGTQFMSSYGVYCLKKATHLMEVADLIATISLEALNGRVEPFNPLLHTIRKQNGQTISASRVRHYLEGSEIGDRFKKHVQDPYSLRCVPQVHGATRQVLKHVIEVFTNEINGVTDNPNLFPEEGLILSGGNFHGQPLALALDYLAMGMAELGNISERRTYLLISGDRGLPVFLSPSPGLNSGLMIPQYTAAALVSENKQFCTPASVDSITSSNGQEDHVSMGANAATKCLRVIENLESVLSIELLTAVQAIEFRDYRTSKIISSCIKQFRQSIPFIEEDVFLKPLIDNSLHFIKETINEFTVKPKT